jgi:hypothetical protein
MAPVPESANDLYLRALAAADAEGRLPLPPLDEWDTFPFEGELRTRRSSRRETTRGARARVASTAHAAPPGTAMRCGATWRADHVTVAQALAAGGGRAHV